MTHRLRDDRKGSRLSPDDPQLHGNPIDFIAELHLREREICALIDRVATSEAADGEVIARILKFLLEELPVHLQDEEEGLFPLMRERCEPDDEIDTVIGRLHSDHRHVKSETPRVIDIILGFQNSGTKPSTADRQALTSYASHARRHLILENAIILPIARKRLSTDDMASLLANMMERRHQDHRANEQDPA